MDLKSHSYYINDSKQYETPGSNLGNKCIIDPAPESFLGEKRESMSDEQIRIPKQGERTFIVRIKSAHKRTLWLDRIFISTIELSPIVYKTISESTWKNILYSYEVEGLRCDNYVIERNFEDLKEVMSYLERGGRITNLDESCSCYVRVVNNELRFDTGEILDPRCVNDHPTSWKPFYPSLNMIKAEPQKLIKGLLRLNRNMED